MKDLCAGGVRAAALIGVASLLLAASARPALAQRGSPGATAAGRRIDTLTRQGEQYEREHLGREGDGKAEAPRDRRRGEAAAGQVRRDFEGLQTGYNQIVLAMKAGAGFEVESVLDSVAEVKKCAARLRHNLSLPKSENSEAEKARRAAAAPKVEESLLMLRKHIYSFVTNPLFESAPVLNVEQAEKAARDLDMILELTEAIGKSGGRTKEQQD
ncbi:MAG TPA: hypothetical protein VGV38_23235 [Pyrinomonadaceae bacterium]|nr:hypothetical protein [Pyrinomonadaceae bacterium]